MDQTLVKQELLKNEIFEKGYDIDNFTTYLDSLKANGGSDIEVWSVEELQQAVAQYQTENKPSFEVVADQSQQEAQQIENAIPSVMQQVLTQNPNLEQDDANFFKVINCRRSQTSTVSECPDPIRIEVVSFEKKAGTLFTSAYVIYRITTKPMGWDVMRRYNDFTWLRDTLIKMYPGICIPPIPKKSSTRSFQDQYLHKRMMFLQRFLNKILASRDLIGDRYLEAFLASTNEKEFKQLQKESEKPQKVTKLDHLSSPNERVTMTINSNVNGYLKNSQELLTNLEFFYKRVRKQSKQMIVDFDNLANTMYALGDSFAQLFSISQHFGQSVKDGANPLRDDMFITLNNLLVQWGNIMSAQTKQIQDSFSGFFKFYHHEVYAQKDYLKTRDQAAYEFERFKQRLDLKKDKLFQGQEMGRWEIPPAILQQLRKDELLQNKKITMLMMLPKETSAQMDLRDIYGYYNNIAFEELKRVADQNILDWAQHFSTFVKEESDVVTQLHMLWADMLTNLQAFGGTESKRMQLMEGSVRRSEAQQQN